MPQFMCEYGNCNSTETPIVVTQVGERKRFCCMEHATLYLVREMWMVGGYKADFVPQITAAIAKHLQR